MNHLSLWTGYSYPDIERVFFHVSSANVYTLFLYTYFGIYGIRN